MNTYKVRVIYNLYLDGKYQWTKIIDSELDYISIHKRIYNDIKEIIKQSSDSGEIQDIDILQLNK